MTSGQQQDLSSERVCGQSGTNIDHLECSICQKILWKPVACETCETPFCSACIHQWLVKSPNKCPNQCEPYVERKCPPLTTKLLSQLQISCSYQPNGCQQIIPYEALEKHELECDYQPQFCPGCRCQIPKRYFIDHVDECSSMELACSDCKMVYKRGEIDIKHTENQCLREQLRLVRDECKEMRVTLHSLVMVIMFNDLPAIIEPSTFPDIYCGLKWTEFYYSNKKHVLENRPHSGYVTPYVPDTSSYLVWACKESKINTEHSDETFSLISVTAYSAWNDDLQLTMKAYRNSTQVFIGNVTLWFGKPQRILLGWRDINEVIFEPSGGNPHPDTGRTNSSFHFVVHQLTIC